MPIVGKVFHLKLNLEALFFMGGMDDCIAIFRFMRNAILRNDTQFRFVCESVDGADRLRFCPAWGGIVGIS